MGSLILYISRYFVCDDAEGEQIAIRIAQVGFEYGERC